MSKFEELLVKKGLYNSVAITIEDLEELNKLLSSGFLNGYNINCFCEKCNEMRTYESVDKTVHEEHGFISMVTPDISGSRGRTPKKEELFNRCLNKRYCLSFRCTRNHEHSLLFDLLVTNEKMIKIGQYPSFADISIGDITKYKSVLGKNYKEYSTALGLFSHGIGIGSFVYLRRIIENLVFDKYKEVKDTLSESYDNFIHSEFKDKLSILKEHLPSILIDNKNVYGIVSKGIHELSEEKCYEMFPFIKVGIELILDEIITKKERDKKNKLFTSFIADTTGELNK